MRTVESRPGGRTEEDGYGDHRLVRRVARVESVRLGAGNDAITEAVLACDRTGIDAPFGWPDAFVRMVSDHHAGRLSATSGLADRDGRRPLTKRRTDLVVQAATGISPLQCVGRSHRACRVALRRNPRRTR